MCVCTCMHVSLYYRHLTQSHINYSQIGYWSHTRCQYWSCVCSLVVGHETLFLKSLEEQKGKSQFGQSQSSVKSYYIHNKQKELHTFVEGTDSFVAIQCRGGTFKSLNTFQQKMACAHEGFTDVKCDWFNSLVIFYVCVCMCLLTLFVKLDA